MKFSSIAAAAVVIVLAVLLTACGGGEAPGRSGGHPTNQPETSEETSGARRQITARTSGEPAPIGQGASGRSGVQPTVQPAPMEETSGATPESPQDTTGAVSKPVTGGDEKRGDAYSGPSLSVQNLAAVPASERGWAWVGMLDAQAFVAGDPPREIMAAFGLFDVGEILDDALYNRGGELEIATFEEHYGIPIGDVATVTVLRGTVNEGSAFLLQGDFSDRDIRTALNEGRYWKKAGESEDIYFRNNGNGAAFFPDDGYLLLGDGADVEVLFHSLSAGPLRPQRPGGWPEDTGITFPGGALENVVVIAENLERSGERIWAIHHGFDFDRVRYEFTGNGGELVSSGLLEYWSTGVALSELYDYVLLGEAEAIGAFLGNEITADVDLFADWNDTLGISLVDVDVAMHLAGLGWAYVVEGNYDQEAVRTYLAASEEAEAVEGESVEYEAWEAGRNTVAMVDNRIYVNDLHFERAREFFLDTLARGENLLENREDPLVRAMDRAGRGWLLVGWHSDYCGKLELEAAGCRAMALAATTGDESTVEVNWVTLFDSAETARGAADEWSKSTDQTMGFFDLPGVSDPDSDGEFVIVEASVPVEAAVRFLNWLISEGPGRRPELFRP